MRKNFYIRVIALTQILALSSFSVSAHAQAPDQATEATIDQLGNRLDEIEKKANTVERIVLAYGIIGVALFFAGAGVGVISSVATGFVGKAAA